MHEQEDESDYDFMKYNLDGFNYFIQNFNIQYNPGTLLVYAIDNVDNDYSLEIECFLVNESFYINFNMYNLDIRNMAFKKYMKYKKNILN